MTSVMGMKANSTIRLFSPAKVNLLIAVTGKRADGFHDLVSLVSPISFGDYVSITLSDKPGSIDLICDAPAVPTGESNLVVAAAKSFLEKINSQAGLTIELEKNIPMEAGLGGGSSNGATTLLILNQLFDEPLSFDELGDLAAGLGSDCPLFLYRQPLLMRGRGERIEMLKKELIEALEGRKLAIFKPDFGVSTSWAYNQLAKDARLYAESDSLENAIERWKAGDLPIFYLLKNSFEKPVFEKFIAIPALFDLVEEVTGLRCLMSGSGSCCFAFVDNDADIEPLKSLVHDAWGKHSFFQVCELGLLSNN
ncbi:MAG: 4-(cytidine 5'-diphospho)-2-C-methyl-D-erythritol kinase [Verrucomicrobia bacterium]|nr:4-(cytidine 5'-diphospho)-2-C-methyl-D-erythritol kinase [Verrucomicrobiota bacterium]